MALIRRDKNAQPETGDAGVALAEPPAAAPAAPAPAAAAPAPAAPAVQPPAPAAAATTAVAVRAPTAIAVSVPKLQNVLEALKDNMRVDWNTLARVKATQGRFVLEDGNKNLGEWMDIELLSYQDNWVLSPGSDSAEAKELARYSDDGKTVKDTGEDCNVYIDRLKSMGYDKAALRSRVVIVGAVQNCEKDVVIDEDLLIQADLATTSKSKWDAYRSQAAYDALKGKVTGEEIVRIRMTANVSSKNGKDWTVVSFSRTPKA